MEQTIDTGVDAKDTETKDAEPKDQNEFGQEAKRACKE